MSTVSAVSDDLLLLDSLEDFQKYAAMLSANARRHLDILSHTLDPGGGLQLAASLSIDNLDHYLRVRI